MTIGEKIRIHRDKMSLSQEKLAEKLGVTRQSISKWESNRTYPEMNKIIILSKLFEVSVEYLLNVEPNFKKTNDILSEEKIINFYLKNKRVRMRKRISIVLSGLLLFALVFQLVYSIIFIIDTGHLIPDEITIFYIGWNLLSDVILAVPNLFIIPLMLILLSKSYYYLKYKE